jgi:hypothetical protein
MLIIPDIHGRTFWKDAVRGRENEKIIFLGDYVDPYPEEGLPEDALPRSFEEVAKMQLDSIQNLNEIIEFKKAHMDNVILLIGNHDAGYMFYDTGICKSRHDYKNQETIYHIFCDNFDLFQIAYEEFINGKRYIFSHAGLSKEWMIDSHGYFGYDINPDNIVEIANLLFKSKEGLFIYNLGDIDSARARYSGDPYGSVVWADVSEWLYEYVGQQKLTNYAFQVFGHTQLIDKPLITKDIACLDARRAFILNDEGIFCELDGTPCVSGLKGIKTSYTR